MTTRPPYHPETDIPAILEGCYGIMRECAKHPQNPAAKRYSDRTQADAIGWASRGEGGIPARKEG